MEFFLSHSGTPRGAVVISQTCVYTAGHMYVSKVSRNYEHFSSTGLG